MDLNTVLRHYNKSGFSIKHIECDGEFKSIMDEVIDDTVIEIKYSNQDYHIPEAESINRVIKMMFCITYYQFPHKKIPRIMICHLVIDMAQILNLFPAKVVLLAHYSSLIILS